MRGARCEVRGAKYEVRGARCEVRGTKYEVRSYLFDFAVLELADRIAVNSFASLNKNLLISGSAMLRSIIRSIQ